MGVKASGMFEREKIHWQAFRETIDLVEVATRLLGPAPGRSGEGPSKLWWSCPLGMHEDDNPSFCVVPGTLCWRCFGCGEKGDAAKLVMKVGAMSFPEAKAYLTGGDVPTIAARSTS